MWTNKGNTLQGDFFAIALVNGYPQLSFNLGRQKTLLMIRSKVRVNDGAWHTIVAHRRKRVGTISVDGETPAERGVADPGASLLNTSGRLWIGMKKSPYCINSIVISLFFICIDENLFL
ncbi:hypothetical protein J437_LFUL003087 [Ladona fulva]|uniref:Laminin G domain-containing protein n=1 Tax=Ladona fulva TaxID=123851 RepID=A0A8K0NWT2_LADFU|nr:hypothetical protein J437_LFUL003087 [Ladona fulva]